MKFELRRWREEEYVTYYKDTRRESLQLFIFDPFPPTIKQCRDWILRCTGSENRHCFRAIVIDCKVVGCIGIRIGDGVCCHDCELFFWLCKDVCCTDYLAKIVEHFCCEMFRIHPIVRISASPLCCHSQAQCVLQKACFVQEGRKRKCAYIDGEYHDRCLYALYR